MTINWWSIGKKDDRGIYVEMHAVGLDNRKHLFSHHSFQLSLFPKPAGIEVSNFITKHRIHFTKICFPSNFSMYSVLQRLSALNLKPPLLEVQGCVTQHRPPWTSKRVKQQLQDAGRDQLYHPHKPYQLQAEQVRGGREEDTWNSRWLKKMHTANSSLYSINSIFLRGFPKYF